MASFPNQEHRPLKKPRLGSVGPDIYQQDKKQREDEMTHMSVKQGFSNQCLIKDEHASAKDCALNASKVALAFAAILTKKQEINTFQDQSKKKFTVNTKDNFWPAGLSRGKLSLESWFKDLAGTKALTQLAKKVPVFNKKEEIFQKLFEDNVPLMRAAWFIKMTNAYNTAVSEAAKAKKRQTSDPFLEWTQALTKYLRDQLQKILEYYQGSGTGSAVAAAQSGFLTAASTTTVVDLDGALRQWNYGTQLAQFMYSQGLLDRHEFLSWIIELLEKVKIVDDTVVKLILAQVLKYMAEFVQSHMLSRRLAYFCCKRLSQICSDSMCIPSPSPQAPSADVSPSNANAAGDAATAPVSSAALSAFAEFCNCPQHRSLMLCLSAIVQATVMSCPSALVWHNLGDGKTGSPLSGSPLDLLPCSPSSLPMPAGSDNKLIRMQLQEAEEQIISRSTAAEIRWSSDKQQLSAKGQVISHVLNCLETIDKQNFERVESSNSLDVLYHKLFAGRQNNKDENDVVVVDEPIINLMLEWAVSTKRTGEHRAVVVAKLLEKYQNDLQSEKSGDGDANDDRESTASEVVANAVPLFQTQLMQFLDKSAPVLEENPTVDNRQAFSNLVLLFTELIRYDVFSHDVYVCSLISRGDVQSSNNINTFQMSLSSVNPYMSELSSVKSEGVKHELMAVKSHEEMKMELESQNLDSEFGMFSFKEEPKSSPDRPASVMSSSMEQSMLVLTPSQTQVQVPTPSGYHSGPTAARTPGAPMTPMSARTPGPPHTPSMAHTPGNITPGGSSFHASGGGVGLIHTPVSAIPSSQAVPLSSERSLGGAGQRGPPRHLVFLTHFPIPIEDQVSSHESNQRMMVLYGVGRQRDEARHTIKKITKEISKLLSKKNSVDLSGGDSNIKTKKKKEKDGGDQVLSFDNTFNKFRKLCFYDGHAVTQAVAKLLSETVSGFAVGTGSYLPQIDYVSFLFDLMEYCLNISQLLDLAIQLLKDLPEVGNQLLLKAGGRMSVTYTTALALCIVGILRKYHASLLLSQEQTASAFDSLCKIVKHVAQPSDCTSAERAILAHLYDLYTSCSHLKSKYGENFGGPCAKVKSTIYAEVKPSSSNLRWEEHFAKDLMDNPRSKIDPQFVKQLNDTPANRYSFVCSALVNICCCQSSHNDRLNDISILCAELTACCNALSSEWLGVLKALCWSSDHDCGFIDVLTQVDVDFSIHDSLAVFTAVMIVRHCFTLENLVRNVALQSLLAACPSVGSGGDPDAENGARLTCHLLLRLFQMMNASPSSSTDARRGTVFVRSSCDRHLLEAAHHRISVGAVVAVLKALLMLGDSGNSEMRDRSSSNKMDAELDVMSLLRNLDDDGDLGMNRMNSRLKGHMESAGLSEYAKHCLREICSLEWVREKFLKETDQLFTADLLLDKMLSHRQAEHLVQMICYPGGLPSILLSEDDDDDDEPEQRRHVTRILHHVDQWSQRVSWLELQLMLKQASATELSPLLDSIAKSTIEVFQQHSSVKQEPGTVPSYSHPMSRSSKDCVWLITPLMAKLSSLVQGRILRHAGLVLETGNNFWSVKNLKDRERYLQKSTMLLGNQPFLSLVLTCLRGQDEQRQDLLKSLHDQLEKFVTNAKEQQDRGQTFDEKLQRMMQEALQLRLSLVGIMFDMIQRSNALTQEWSTLLIQLISSGVVDILSNAELFTIIIDMLSMLIHGTLASDSSEKGEDNKKVYQNLIRKLKKEIGERKSPSIDFVRQLLPLPKVYCEIIVYDHLQSGSGDSRGANTTHKSGSGSDGEQRKQGLQISKKERVSPWDILEGHKNPAPLNLSWFCAARLERKPLKFEEQHRLLLYHTHSMKKPLSYFLEPILLPPEDLEPPAEKFVDVKIAAEHQVVMMMEAKHQQQQQLATLQSQEFIRLPTPPGVAHGPRPQKRSRTNRKPQPAPPIAAAAMPPGAGMPAAQGRISGTQPMPGPYLQPGSQSMTFVRPDMYATHPPQGMPQNWAYNQQQQTYQQQMQPVVRGSYGNTPRDALRNTVMRMRPMGSGYMPSAAGAAVPNASWNTSPVRVPNPAMTRMPQSAGPPRQICLDPPTYSQQQAQQAGMFQNVPGQGMMQGGAYGVYSQQTMQQQQSSSSQPSSMMDSAPPYQGGHPSASIGGGAGSGATSSAGSMQQQTGQPQAGYMTTPGGNAAQQTGFGANSSRFGHMTGALGGPGSMGSSSGGPPGYNQPTLGRQSSGGQQQMQGAPPSGSNSNYIHQQQQRQRQAALLAQQQQQQQQQQHMAAVQSHGTAAGQVQPSSAAGLMSLQRQMSSGGNQQPPSNQYNPYQYN